MWHDQSPLGGDDYLGIFFSNCQPVQVMKEVKPAAIMSTVENSFSYSRDMPLSLSLWEGQQKAQISK